MTINVTLNSISNLQDTTTAQTQLNQNNTAIVGGFTTALNVTGDQMKGNLDMNSNQILNLPAPATANSPVRLQDIGSTASATPAIISGNNVYTGNNSFTGTTQMAVVNFTEDARFKSGDPWVDVKAYGATGNGSTDDTTALQAAINAAAVLNGQSGTVFFPPGSYLISSALNVPVGSSYLTLLGSTPNSSIITVGSNDISAIDINGTGVIVSNLRIEGSSLITTSNATVNISSGNSAFFNFCNIINGYSGISCNGSDCIFNGITIADCYGPLMFNGSSLGGMYMFRCGFDQNTPTGSYDNTNTINNWAANTAYTKNTIVELNGAYYIQCVTSGTSTSFAPTIKGYGLTISDGTATWQLVCPVNYAALGLISGVNYIQWCDITGPYVNGIIVQGGDAFITDCTVSTLEIGMSLVSGTSAVIRGNRINGMFLSSNSLGISVGGTFAGDSIFSENIISGLKYGISIATSKNNAINNNYIVGNGTGIQIQPNVSNFSIANNMMATSSTFGNNINAITVASGSSNNYIIVHNLITGASTGVSDGGSGGNKIVVGNI
jgi:hypothetical protein